MTYQNKIKKIEGYLAEISGIEYVLSILRSEES
jgi:hypothetical protein